MTEGFQAGPYYNAHSAMPTEAVFRVDGARLPGDNVSLEMVLHSASHLGGRVRIESITIDEDNPWSIDADDCALLLQWYCDNVAEKQLEDEEPAADHA